MIISCGWCQDWRMLVSVWEDAKELSPATIEEGVMIDFAEDGKVIRGFSLNIETENGVCKIELTKRNGACRAIKEITFPYSRHSFVVEGVGFKIHTNR